MARKKKHEEHENHERWLVSYADFITLLFAFFVVMYSVSAVNAGKFRVLSEALEAAFRATPRSTQPIQVGKIHRDSMIEPLMMRKRRDMRGPQGVELPEKPQIMGGGGPVESDAGDKARDGAGDGRGADGAGRGALGEIAERVEKAFQSLIKEGLVTVRRDRHWVEVEIRTNVLFASGSADLGKGPALVLRQIAKILREYPNHVHVEGFTDDVPINTIAFPSNWELSAARAASVVHLFSDSGVKPERMAAVGYGQFRPAADNATEDGRRKNRKVVIVILAAQDEKHLPDIGRAGNRKEPAGDTGGDSPASSPAQGAAPAQSGEKTTSPASGS